MEALPNDALLTPSRRRWWRSLTLVSGVMFAVLMIAVSHGAFVAMYHFVVLMIASIVMRGKPDNLVECLALLGRQNLLQLGRRIRNLLELPGKRTGLVGMKPGNGGRICCFARLFDRADARRLYRLCVGLPGALL